MTSHLARPDEWTYLIDGALHVFVRRDSLMPRDWATRFDLGVDDRSGWDEIRVGSMPAGGRFLLAPGLVVPRSSSFPQLDTEQFRAQIPSDHVRVIHPDQIRRAIGPTDPWADTEERS